VVSRHGVPHEAQPMVRSAERPVRCAWRFLADCTQPRVSTSCYAPSLGCLGHSSWTYSASWAARANHRTCVRCTRSLPTMRVSVSVRLLPANVSRFAARLRRGGGAVALARDGPACGAGSVRRGRPRAWCALGGIAELVDDGTTECSSNQTTWWPGARPSATSVDPSLWRLACRRAPAQADAAVAEDMLSGTASSDAA